MSNKVLWSVFTSLNVSIYEFMIHMHLPSDILSNKGHFRTLLIHKERVCTL